MSFSTSTTRIGFSETSFSIARTTKPQPRLLLALLLLSWVLKSILGSFFHIHLARVSSNVLSPSGWVASTCFIVAAGEPSSALPPSSAAIGSLFRAPSSRRRVLVLHRCELLGTDTNGCLPRAAICHGPHDSTSHEPPAMAPPATALWRRFLRALRRRFTRAIVRHVFTSRDSFPLAEHTTVSPSFTCCASRVVRCVRLHPSLSPLRNRGTLAR